MSLLNLHDDERSKPSAWIPVGWLPIYDDKRDKRPKKGYHGTSARKIRLYHRCWIEFLDNWAEKTKDAQIVYWADGICRLTRFFVGGLLGDQQESDKYTAESCVCHRCHAPRSAYLQTDHFNNKTMLVQRRKVERAAEGGNLAKRSKQWIVRWDRDGRNVRPGPGARLNYFNYFNYFHYVNYSNLCRALCLQP